MGRLDDKVAIITGASRGIGRSTAELFLVEDARVILVDKDDIDWLRGCHKGCLNAYSIKADLRDAGCAEDIIRFALEKFSGIDILVNNAGIFECIDFLKITEESFQAMMEVNLRSVFFLCQSAISYFLKSGSGTIVNVASVSGKIGSSSSAHYAITKAGIIALTKSLGRKFGPNNIKVNAVAPSLIETGMAGQLDQGHLEKLIENIPLKRMGKPEEVASVILFLASRQSDYIAGQTLVVDGGICMV